MSMTLRWLHPLTSPATDGSPPQLATQIGGKALSLARMWQAGIPVPAAWVIPIECSEYYHSHGGEFPPSLRGEVQQLLNQHLPFPVAVRSGAEVSMPGMLRTVLHCSTTEEVTAAIQTVLDSWQSRDAWAFRQRHRLTHLQGTAVILQAMVTTTVAGVMLTRDPLRPESDAIVVEAVRGTGESLVSGSQAGQRWSMSRDLALITASDRHDSPLLTSSQLRTLAKWGLRIESIFGEPVDVEWGIDGDQFWFFQARPIAKPSLQASDDTDWSLLLDRENRRLTEFRQRGEKFWVMHSMGESLPHPTPLTWSIVQRFMSGQGGYGTLYRQLGYSPSSRIRTRGFLELIAGKIYASADQLPDLFVADFPFGFDREELRLDPGSLEHGPQRLDLDRVGPWFLLRIPLIYWALLRARRKVARLTDVAHRNFVEHVRPVYHDWLHTERSRPLIGRPTAELIGIWKQRVDTVLHRFAPQLMLPGVLGAAALEEFRRGMLQVGGRDISEACCQELLAGLQVPVLDEMGRGAAAWHDDHDASFLDRFGHRGTEEMELSQPTWREAPETIPRLPLPKLRPPGDAAPARVEARLTDQKPRFRAQILKSFQRSQELLADRETGKDELMKGYNLIREVCRELERSTDLGSDLYFLTDVELERFPTVPDRPTLQRRRTEWECLKRLPHPTVIDESGLTTSPVPLFSTGEQVNGVTISPGRASGLAWIRHLHSDQTPPDGVIAILDLLRPSDLAQLAAVRGFVVEQSALLSHGAMLARQLGIPVIQWAGAGLRIQDGERLHILDGAIVFEHTSIPRAL